MPFPRYSWVQPSLVFATATIGAITLHATVAHDATGDSTARVSPKTRAVSSSAPACKLLRRVLRHDLLYRDSVLAGDATVRIVVSVAPPEISAVLTAISTAGGTIGAKDDAVGYVRATLPTSAFPRIACIDGIDAIEVDGEFRQPDITLPVRTFGRQVELGHRWAYSDIPTPTESSDRTSAESRSQPTLTFPLDEMGIDRFQRDHPTFDGRGVTIALVEWMPDLLEPGLWESIDGQPKVLRPLFDWSEPPTRYLVRLTEGTVTQGAVTIGGQQYRVPAFLEHRQVRVGTTDEREHGYFTYDLNRDGNPNGSDPLIGVLRDLDSNQIWVDVGQNHDFSDDRSYRCGGEPLLVLGTDKPATLVRESQGIFVLCDAAHPFKALFVPTGNRHGTGVAAVAAGTRFPLGGRGVAPGARLLPSLLFDGRTSTYTEAHLRAFRDPRVQIINSGLASTRRLHDGRSVTSLVLDRAVRHYRKLVFSSGGNAPSTLEAAGEAANGTEVISVGAFASSRTLTRLLGAPVADGDLEFWVGAPGPRADGRYKPDLLASAAGLVPTSSVHEERDTHDSSITHGASRISWATSYSSPAAAGAAAVLLSAARQSGLKASADDVKAALIVSARRLSAYSASKQGAGLLSLPDAWEALRKRERFLRLDVRAPVSTVMTRDEDVAPFGPGLFEREGWTTADLGTSRTRILQLTRREGTAVPMRVRLRVLGDEETFAVPSSIDLPLDRAVDVPLRISPRKAGSHDALLRLTDAATGRLHANIQLTVVVAIDAPAPGTSIRLEGEIPYPATGRHFIRLPETPLSIEWDLTLHTDAWVIPFLVNPAGIYFPYYADFQRRHWRYTLDAAESGVWEVAINHMDKASDWRPNRPPPRPMPYSLTLTSRAPRVLNQQRTSTQIEEAQSGSTISRSVGLSSDVSFGATEFYVARNGATLDVTAARAPEDTCAADYRLILQRCEGRCMTIVGSTIASVDAHVSARTVQAGIWRAVVWRSAPASCPQHFAVRVGITPAPVERETAAR